MAIVKEKEIIKTDQSTETTAVDLAKVKVPGIQELISSGLHWGHKRERIWPKNRENIFGVKSGMHIINVYKTQETLKEAIAFIKSIIDSKNQILFIATKPSVSELVADFAQKISMPYVVERWIGGAFTNNKEIKKSIDRLKKLESDFATGEIKKYPRHEQLTFAKDRETLEKKFGGLKVLDESKLKAVFIHDLKKDQNAFKEALAINLPVISLVDTNIDNKNVAYPIIANDDSYDGFKLILDTIISNL